MSMNNQARNLMMRHTQLVRNRQESMLERAANEIGLDINPADYSSSIQGKADSSFRVSYDRSGGSMS